MKAAIYVRTSTQEQVNNLEGQKDACIKFAQNKGYDIEDVYIEQLSAFKKNIPRPHYDTIKNKAHRGEIRAVIVWALDRWIRDRETLLNDISTLRNYGCKLHSVQEEWLEAINIDGPMGKTIQDFLLGLVGSLAELESQRKSERVKMAYKKIKSENRRYKKWGRRELPQRITREVFDLKEKGFSIRKIAENVFYYDKNKNLKNVSTGKVSEILNGVHKRSKQK